MSYMVDSKVVIVGAGVSGLYGAYLLAKRGFKRIVVLEAQSKTGGRIQPIKVSQGGETKTFDLGGQWVHGQSNNPLWKFLQEHKVS